MVGFAPQRGRPSQFIASSQMSLTRQRSSSRIGSCPGSRTTSTASPSTEGKSQFWDSCDTKVLTPTQKPASPDPLGIHQVVTWKRIAKDTKLALELQAHERYATYQRQSTDLVQKLPPAEDDDFSQPVMINPVTMEEMIILPRPVSPERVEETFTAEIDFQEECSPNKAYMISNGSFPGSSHIAGGENALLLSSIY